MISIEALGREGKVFGFYADGNVLVRERVKGSPQCPSVRSRWEFPSHLVPSTLPDIPQKPASQRAQLGRRLPFIGKHMRFYDYETECDIPLFD